MSLTADTEAQDKALLGSIGDNHRIIKALLARKASTIRRVQSAMDYKARTKTPLNERQQHIFNEFAGLYAKEGGKLRQSLMGMEHIQEALNHLHNERRQHIFREREAFLQSLFFLHKHQSSAIASLHRLIASGERTLSSLK